MEKQLKEVIDNINKCIEDYQNSSGASPHQLIETLRLLTTNLYTLETYRSEYKKLYEQQIYTKVNEGDSVARSVNFAEIQVPELYKLRRIMEACYEVVGALRTQISFLKQELNNQS